MRSYVHMEEYGVYCLDIHSAIFKIAIFQLKYKYIYAYMCTYIVNSHMLMWAYICICVCVCIYMHMYIYECVYIYVYICTNTKNHWHAQVCKYARIKIVYHLDIHCDIFNISYVCDLPLSFCTFAYTHTHTHTHTHTQTHTHTHTHTNTCTHIYTRDCSINIYRGCKICHIHMHKLFGVIFHCVGLLTEPVQKKKKILGFLCTFA